MQNPTPVEAAPVFRNQQVVVSSTTAGSNLQKPPQATTRQALAAASLTQILASFCVTKSWQGAYQGAYRKLSRWLGLHPSVLSRLSEAEDIASEKAYRRLLKRLRG